MLSATRCWSRRNRLACCASGKRADDERHDAAVDEHVHELERADLDEFRAFLRSLVMHAAVGTALGGVATLVGEPQNLLIASVAGWSFGEFFVRVAPVLDLISHLSG